MKIAAKGVDPRLVIGVREFPFSRSQNARVGRHLSEEITVTPVVEASLNVIGHAQKPEFFFRRNGRVHLNRRGSQFSRLLAPMVCASATVMLDTPCSEVV